jgi:hypothetical protein
MHSWTTLPGIRAATLVALLALAACEGGLSFGAPASVAVAGGAVTVAGPAGYCVDSRLSRTGGTEAFVVLGSCAAFSPVAARPEGTPAVLTATVSAEPAAPPEPGDLERFLRSPQGRAAISRTGRAETVEILSTRREQGVLLLHIRDEGAGAEGPATDSAYWRAVFGLNGRLVTATVLAFADRPLSPDQGFRLLDAFVDRLKAANPTTPA